MRRTGWGGEVDRGTAARWDPTHQSVYFKHLVALVVAGPLSPSREKEGADTHAHANPHESRGGVHRDREAVWQKLDQEIGA